MRMNIDSKKKARSGAWIPRAIYGDPRIIEVSGDALAVLVHLLVWADADGQLTTPSGERFTSKRLAILCRFEEAEVDAALAELRWAGAVEVSEAGWRVLGWQRAPSAERVSERVRKHRAGRVAAA